ncbi:hypothetical protein [Elizabethkingia ursingii]|uniref:hypothetical protein n=1 Tax=Elizabethkingia ursingii TaxID=1756150 RepID=UPI0007517BC5|nr:hypothetical protein [Elizabethkingia ursingii]KUY29787.1 hypothetical protein ATB96_17870 [Elizabethkingia ursingii]
MKKEDVFLNFISIYENKFPVGFSNLSSLSEIFYVLITLYFFSGILGSFLSRIVFIFGLDKRFSFFRFQHQWDYLTVSNKQNNTSHKLGDIHYTKVDIKTNDDQLFTGKLHDIILDKDTKVEAIALQETYKFYKLDREKDKDRVQEISQKIHNNDPFIIFHLMTKTQFIYKKRIMGDIFTIPHNKIENISITFIKISHILRKFQHITKYIVSVLLLLVLFFSVTYAIWDYHLINFDAAHKRIMFCILLPITSIAFILFILGTINKIENKAYFVTWAFIILVFVSLPYLYIFSIVSFTSLIIILILSFIFIAFVVKSIVNKLIKE